jgi:hypothetical protein
MQITSIVRIGLVVALTGGSLAMATEQPKHEVLKTYDDFEVRAYAACVVAETEVEGEQTEAGSAAFSVLAGYIFGNNGGSKKIAMTAPVTQAAAGEKIAMTAPVTQTSAGTKRWKVQFMMPSEYRLETLPEPKDARVHLREVPARRVAAMKYSGTWSQQNYDEHLAALRAAMKREGLEPAGEPTWARYDPPYKPWFMRKNEILIEVSQ